MSNLPVVSGDEAVKRFLKLGYTLVRKKGSHMRLKPPSDPHGKLPLTIPRHANLGKGLLRKLLRDAGVTVEEFEELGK
jgi:predicted RNA binding protein YcfA (HicA-like mRNA interferase family)